jgi:hypothetical protein
MTCSILFVIRSTIQAAPGLDADMALPTLLASGLSILTAGVFSSTSFGLFGALLGAICLTLARWISRAANPGGEPQRNAWIGAGVAAVLTTALNLAFINLTGAYFAALWPFGWLFWIGLPSLLLVIVIAWAAQKNRP